jgi:anti-sigma regulatory factor (Ser/Thr protein kinase)
VRRVRRLAERIARELGLDAVTAFHIKVALNEAATNGIVHGCRTSVDRVRVRARADAAASALVVDVVDPGGRFRRAERLLDPLAGSGRGTALLEATTDELQIEVEPGRTSVRFVKRLDAHAVVGGRRADLGTVCA